MRQKTQVLVVLGIAIGLITGLFLLSDKVMKDTPEELKLSDFLTVFTADTVIIIGDRERKCGCNRGEFANSDR